MREVITKVYTITQGLVEANLVAIISQISYFGTLIYILIDCGTTHYFVTKSLIERLEVQPVKIA